MQTFLYPRRFAWLPLVLLILHMAVARFASAPDAAVRAWQLVEREAAVLPAILPGAHVPTWHARERWAGKTSWTEPEGTSQSFGQQPGRRVARQALGARSRLPPLYDLLHVYRL